MKKAHFKILYYMYNWILFVFPFTLVDLVNYSTMTFIYYTCIHTYINIYLYVRMRAHYGSTFFVSGKRDCGYYKWFAVHWLHAIIWFFSPCVCSESFLLIYCYLSCYLLLMVVRDFLHFSMQSSWLWKKLNYHESVYMPLLFLVFVLFFI